MTRTERFLVAVLIVAALSFAGMAIAQDGAQSPGALIDAKNAEQDAALAERAEIDAVIGAEIISLKETGAAQAAAIAEIMEWIAAHDDGQPTEPTEPDPVDPDPVDPEPVEPATPWPAFIVDLDSGEKTLIVSAATALPAGRYTIQIGESENDALPDAPFRTRINGASCGPDEQYAKYHVCGNDNAAPFYPGENAVVIEGLGTQTRADLTIIIAGAPPTGPPPAPGAFFTQVGAWFLATYNLEQPCINLLKCDDYLWRSNNGLALPALFERGHLDARTGLPVNLPAGDFLISGSFFTPGEYNYLWDGCWVLDWKGEAEIWIRHLGRDGQTRSDRRIEFCRDATTRDLFQIQINRIDAPLTELRLYRAEDEAAINAGRVWRPAFAAAVGRYDYCRTMDLQSANSGVIRSVDDIAPMDAQAWGRTAWGAATGEPDRKAQPEFQALPIEAALRLGVEAGCKVWFQAPITLGAPKPFFDYRPADDRIDVWAHAFGEGSGAIAAQVLESPEWDRYADAFVAALIDSGYPADREIVASLANEVWNWSNHYWLTTKYAERMGAGLRAGDYLGIGDPWIREAYGAMVARFKLAVDGALERAGRTQKITYAVEGQAAWISLTGGALRGAKAYIEKHGERWTDHAPAFGVSVASYWATNGDLEQTGVDFHDAAALETLILNGPDNILGTRANVVKLFRGAKAEGAKYGVRLIGAYEGGPHFGRPWLPDEEGGRNYLMTEEEYQDFVWGSPGGRINLEINKTLAAEFPGIILSNYALAGAPNGQPWFEGPLGATNPYARSWEALIELSQETRE